MTNDPSAVNEPTRILATLRQPGKGAEIEIEQRVGRAARSAWKP
jgi:hypothetical protein